MYQLYYLAEDQAKTGMTRSFFPSLVLLLLSLNGIAQVELETEIDSLTLFLNGAAVHRSKSIELDKGKNRFRFVALSPKLRSGTVRLEFSDPDRARILSISDHRNHFTKATHSERVDELKAEKEKLRVQKDSLQGLRDGLAEERRMIQENRDIGGEASNISPEEMEQMADLFRKRIQRIRQREGSLKRKTRELNERLNKIHDQLKELNAKARYRTSEVEILIKAKEPTRISLGLNYLVDGAGWAPFYDIRADGVDGPVELSYRAKVFNDTDVDWDQVPFTLSTSDADLDVSKPELEKWTIDHYQPGGQKSWKGMNKPAQQRTQEQTASKGSSKEKEMLQDHEKASKEPKVRFQKLQVSELSPDFRIEDTYSIPSDAKPYIVEVTEYELPADYTHYTVPKLDESVFLLAGITGWENLGLIEGKANVYFDGSYKGSSYINPSGTDDTLDLSLGRDKKIRVKRKVKREFTSSQLIGNKKKDDLAYKITVKNGRDRGIDIEVHDQYPIPKVDDIDVSLEESSEAQVNERTGRLTWDIELGAGKSRSFSLAYQIKYPKEMNVQKQKFRTISAPSF